MPTYDYKCQACEHTFEQFQPITAKPVKKCPQCGKMSVKRLIGAGSAVIFKGSGFYQTDYRSESYKQAAKADQQSGSKAETAKSESKPASDTTKSTTSKTA
ncbi:MAG: zinc ribbon domain-containing protein [Sedimentisphaerales bacterium]|nr:zinc ribbon domain-containing protein [Sedimentisphaerales bacterium]MBN2843804.1 zinc ribbon domain-containing protein [Sedimentisphaerales bacterium]